MRRYRFVAGERSAPYKVTVLLQAGPSIPMNSHGCRSLFSVRRGGSSTA
ncbi:hypothetical protein [Azospirillum palustre]